MVPATAMSPAEAPPSCQTIKVTPRSNSGRMPDNTISDPRKLADTQPHLIPARRAFSSAVIAA